MKKIFLLALVFISFHAAGQYPNGSQTIGNDSNLIIPKGALKGRLINHVFIDTADANTHHVDEYPGAQIFTSDNKFWLRDLTTTVWINFVVGVTGEDTVYVADDLYVTWEMINGSLKQVIHRLHNDGVVSGGIITWTGTGLIFDVSPVTFYKGGVLYSLPASQVTLDPADVSLGRMDAFIVDTVPSTGFITGTAAADPVTPQEDQLSQIVLATILLNAGDLTPGNVVVNKIYDEHIEWPALALGTQTTDFDNLTNPFTGVKAIYMSSYVNGARLQFTYAGTETVDPGEVVTMRIYPNGKMNNRYSFRWFSTGTAVSNTIIIPATGGFGFNPNDSNAYQIVTIPLSAFSWTQQTFNRLTITLLGTDNVGTRGFYADRIELQTGVNNNPPPNDFSNKLDSVTITKTTVGADTLNVFKTWVKGISKTIGTVYTGGTGGGSGNTNSNIGAGFRWAVPGTNDIKTVFNGYAIGIDSVSNANALTLKLDTSLALTKLMANATFYSTITGLADSSGFTINRPNGTKDTIQFNLPASVTVTSYSKNVTFDSTILLLSNGTRYAARDSVGAGGGGSAALTFTYVGVGDASNLLTGHSNFTYVPSPVVSAAFIKALKVNPNLTATANSQTLVGIDIAPVYSLGAYTSLLQYDLRTAQDISVNTYTLGKGRGNISTNTTFGFETMGNNAVSVTTGVDNTGMGKNVLRLLTTGTSNSAFGANALDEVTTGINNVGIGLNALTKIVGVNYNTAVGAPSQGNNVSGSQNTSIGWSSLGAVVSGSDNTGIGVYALGTTTGSNNLGLGIYGGYGIVSGSNNVAAGPSAMYAASGAATDNTALGHRAGYNNGAGNRNIYIGKGAGELTSGVSDRLFIQNSTSASPLIGGDFAARTAGVFLSGYTARWHLPAGGLAANSAPLKFTYISLATTAASGTGATATLTFAAQTYAPFPVGSQIVVAGVTPAGYNGTVTVTAVTTTTVSYANATTGAQTVAGTIVAGQLLTTPESGAVESDGVHLYWTDATGTRKQLD